MKAPQGLRGIVAAIGVSLAALSLALSPAATRDAAAQADAPALWRVDGPKGRVFLFGSFHLLPADVKWRTPAVESALNGAAVVVFETDFTGAQDPQASQALIAKYGLLPPGQTLPSVLPGSTRAELERAATDLRIPPTQSCAFEALAGRANLGGAIRHQPGLRPEQGRGTAGHHVGEGKRQRPDLAGDERVSAQGLRRPY